MRSLKSFRLPSRLDNGATDRGATLQLGCSRLGITLLHDDPNDAPARGKMERSWRRMREQALDHIGQIAALADGEHKLRTWLTKFYQVTPHAGPLGEPPQRSSRRGKSGVSTARSSNTSSPWVRDMYGTRA